ncbi:RNA polymerase sigma factor [Roseisolibacter agri]|uniref:RNA polymerase sigma factor n=1 Tax=Roseisolibacter agri TaxID=2014610 RepID=A0AA37VA04_9BACT|nr:sigma-70 family RNA polymerase sigma factor [Roseisolibacter agri]GLC24943.1 RNA polymerase sigma factor [Roseisolibacter agri]
MDASDAWLLARLRAGDVDALEQLLRRYRAPLVAYAARVAGPVEAEDVVQETFCRLWAWRATWRPEGSVRGLLYRVTRNLAISRRRRDAARERAARVVRVLGDADAPADAGADLAVEREELRRALARGVGALPPRRRTVFVLRCVHGLSYGEIAGLMDTSTQTVANQLSRALTTLRRSLAPSVLQ